MPLVRVTARGQLHAHAVPPHPAVVPDLPNLKELISIVDYDRPSPAIDPAFNSAGCADACVGFTDATCGCARLGRQWQSTTYFEGNDDGVLAVDFTDGKTPGPVPKSSFYHAWAVRGGP